MKKSVGLKLADEVYLATALLHRENPTREDFTLSDIVDRVAKENLTGELRPGIRAHASLQCVANKAPSPGRHRMLYATGRKTRRLLRLEDDVHPGRTGKIWPHPDDVPPQYYELLEWAKRRYSSSPPPGANRWLEGILRLRGMGQEIWKDQDPDEYVRSLREF